MTMDELRQLDLKNLPDLPLGPQIASLVIMIAAILGLAYYFVFADLQDQIERQQAKEVQLKETFLDKKRQVANLAALEKQLQEIESSFGALLKQLPTKAEMPALLTEINQAGVGRGLLFELFRPGSETKAAQIATLPIQIRLSGSYVELATFVNDVAQLSRIVTIGDISLTPNGSDRLQLQATAKTYRALEAGEQTAKAGKP